MSDQVQFPLPRGVTVPEDHWEQEGRAKAALAAERRERDAAAQLPPAFQWAKIDSPELAERVASKQAIARARMHQDAARLVFLGPAGSGKTSLAAALLRARYVSVGGKMALEPAWRLAVARSRHPLGEGEPEVVMRALAADLLVLDDLGSEKPNHASAVEDIVFERHWSDRATWVTTWMDEEAVAKRYGDGIARRVFERSTVIECGRHLPPHRCRSALDAV